MVVQYVSICALDGLAACPGCPLPSPYVSWDRLQRPRDPHEDEAVLIMDGWIIISLLGFSFPAWLLSSVSCLSYT